MYWAPRYIERFRCITSACEQICCAGWRVAMDQPHYERLRHAMGDSAEERERFERLVERVPGAPTDSEYFATVQMQANGHCAFLDDDRLCSVQRRYGEAFLGNMCAIYPRDISFVHDRIEVTATLSCPEVARQCLLANDAMEMDYRHQQPLPRQHLLRRLHPDPDDSYLRYFDLIRNTMLKLLSATRYPLASRLFFTVYLAQKTAPFFSRGTQPFEDRRLAEELENLERESVLDELHRQFHGMTIPASWALRIIRVIVLARLQVHISGFHQLVVDGLSSYALPASAPAAQADTISVPHEEVWKQYQRRRRYWTTTLGWRLDQMFGNYCQNYWLRDWYVMSPNLLVHTQKLLVRLAILRFLLFSHPRLRIQQDAASHDQTDMGARRSALEITSVEVSYKVLRALEHDPSFLDNVQQALQAEGADSVAHLMFLLKF